MSRADSSFDSLLELQERLAADLTPVVPFDPLRIGAQIGTLGFGFGFVSLLLLLGLRPDAASLNGLWLWLPAVLSVAMGVGLIALALRSLVPGRRAASWVLALAPLAGLLLFGALYQGVFLHSQITVPAETAWQIGQFCFAMEVALAAPILFFVLLAARRGLSARPMAPASVGAFGVTLISDATWRLFCEFSDPVHVASAHLSGMVFVMLLALGVTYIWDYRRLERLRKNRTASGL